eukprot:jgi/Psemu1/38784/gm1.38784_g
MVLPLSKGFLCCSLLLLASVQTRISSVESFTSQNRHRVESQYNRHDPRRTSVKSGSNEQVRDSNKLSFVEKHRLYSSDVDVTENGSNDGDGSIRFLGKGSNAIVRPGVVLLAPAEEFHHYLRQSALFIYSMGVDDNDDYVIRGVIIDNPTPFTIGEMMEESANGGIFENLIYRGGESGGQEAVFVCIPVYQGGDLEKLDEYDPSKTKFFFNYMEFLEQELEDMIAIIHEDGDGWISNLPYIRLHVAPSFRQWVYNRGAEEGKETQ